ncbi:MAG TPA: PhzF family phenazine biosynthesis protein [bacterium]
MIPFYQVDAFTSCLFAGNPAGVCVLDAWLPDATLQAIAAENNLSETAFLVRRGEAFELRWFTPAVEVDLCGHATLASGHVVLNYVRQHPERVAFETKSGSLAVERRGDLLFLDFPTRRPSPCAPPEGLAKMLGAAPVETLCSRDLMVVFDDEATVRGLAPDLAAIARLDFLGVIATAPGREGDFVSRFFAPRAGVPEDPVTGSAHCTLIPYWAERLGRKDLHAFQVSRRGGELFCELRGERVSIGGHAVTYLRGGIELRD